jgi:predicted permease
MEELTRRALEFHADNADFRYTLQTVGQVLLPSADRTIVFVQAGALILILLAVLNLASLLIAWGFDRRQELTVRLALGASGGRIVRMLVLQSLVVVSAGGLVGLLMALLVLPWIRQLDVSPSLALFMSNLELDGGVLLWSAVAVAVSSMLAGALPAWFSRRTDVGDTLRSNTRSVSLSPAAVRWQKAMVLTQATLTVVILTAAVLIAMSFRNIMDVPDGFTPGSRMVARIQLPDAEYGEHEARAGFAARLMDELARETELKSFGFSSTLPVSDVPSGSRFFIQLPDGSLSTEPQLLHFRRTSWNYHEAIGIPILRGRAFTSSDDGAHPNVAIVSRSLAERLWPGEDPVGKALYRFNAGAPPQPVEVVGVAGDVMDGGYSAPAGEAVYVPFAQISGNRMSLVVEPRTSQEAALGAVRRALRTANPVIAASAVASLESLVNQANALPRLQTILLATFALVALGIALLGCYGVMTQLVASRERDTAVRLAYGAPPARVGASVLLQAGTLGVPGVVLGATLVRLLDGVLRPFLFGVDASSLRVTGFVCLTTLLFVALASLAPAARAMRVDIRKGLTEC